MVYIIITTLILTPALVGIGSSFEKIFKIDNKYVSLSSINGMMITAILWTILAFFIPLNIYVEFITFIIGWSGFFYQKKYTEIFKIFKENKIHLSLVSLSIILAGSFFPFILDHFSYYIPSINWLKSYGLIKGISNLNIVLGQMSMWHILQAGFSNFSDVFFRLNSILLVIYSIYIFEKKSWIHLLFLPILFLFAQSPSPDLATFVLSLVILNEILDRNKHSALLFTLSVFIFSIKPTMIWVPIFVFFHKILIIKKSPKFITLGILILLLFIFKNIWCFGYPIFPVQVGDLNVYWKPNAEVLKYSSEIAIRKTYDMQYTISEISHFTRWDYVANWFSLKGIKSIVNIFFLISLMIFGVFTIIKKNKTLSLLFISIVIKSIFVVIFSAQYRFFLDVFFVLVFVLFFDKIRFRKAINIFYPFGILIISFFMMPSIVRGFVPSFKLGNFMGNVKIEQLLKPSSYELNKFSTHKVGNLNFNLVENYPFIFDTPLPSITPSAIKQYYRFNIFPQLESKNIRDGFVWKEMSAKERKELERILVKIDESEE